MVLLNGLPMAPAAKPKIAIKLGPWLLEGFADCFDEQGRLIAQVGVPHGKPPAETREMALSYEDYFSLMRTAGQIKSA